MRRHEQREREAAGGERRLDVLRVEVPPIVDAAGGAAGRKREEEEERIGVAHGHDQQSAIVAPEAKLDVAEDQAAIAADRTLRSARRPRGIEQRKGVVGAGSLHGLGCRRGGDDRLVGSKAVRRLFRAEMDGAASRQGQRRVDFLDGREQLVLDDDGSGPGIVYDVRDLEADQAEVDRRDDQPALATAA